MPELPEVETTCRGIEPHIVNQKVKNVVIRQPNLRWPITAGLDSILINKKILNVSRRAKYILINFNRGTLIVHLGMSGRFCVVDANTPVEKHDHVDIALSNKKILRYNDTRRFGTIQWTADNPLEHKLLASLGPEPLEKGFSATHLLSKSKNKKQAVKQFIMDSKVVVGVGNIYANEALFTSKIHPKTPANEIKTDKYKELVKNIKKILKQSITKGGTTLKDFLSADGKPGYFSQSLLVYGRGGEPCVECETELTEIKLGQRTTVFCGSCQD